MILHIYDPKHDSCYNRLTKSSNTLCDLPVGGTSGVVTVANFMNPYYDYSLRRNTYRVSLTNPGRKYALRHTIWTKWDGFWEAELVEGTFELCKHCAGNEDFALMILAEV